MALFSVLELHKYSIAGSYLDQALPELKISLFQMCVVWHLHSSGTSVLMNLVHYKGDCIVLTSCLRLWRCFMIRVREGGERSL